MSDVRAQIQSLCPGAVVSMYTLDLTTISQGAGSLNFTPSTNELSQKIVWQGVVYEPYPVEASGFEFNGRGAAPRPTLKMYSADGITSALNAQYSDMVGARLIRRRTFAKYLDAVNFPGGVNPDADPTAELPQDVFYVDRKAEESKNGVVYELATNFDLDGVRLPNRLVLANLCIWRYRSWDATTGQFVYPTELACPYVGHAYLDRFDTPKGYPEFDECGKRLASCKARFKNPLAGSVGLPFSGFPGAGRLLR